MKAERMVASRVFYRLAIAAFVTVPMLAGGLSPAHALSELKPIGGDPVTPGQAAGNPPGLDVEAPESPATPSADTTNETPAKPKAETVEFSHDFAKLPEPVRKLREQIIEAAASGDPERLRALIGSGEDRTMLPVAEDDDPIAALKGISGDEDGLEILAIILDLLSTGYAHRDAGKADEVYVWPYFTDKSLSTLTAPEKVELLRIVTAGDLGGMLEYGSYNFFQMGITPDGKWKYLTAGD